MVAISSVRDMAHAFTAPGSPKFGIPLLRLPSALSSSSRSQPVVLPVRPIFTRLAANKYKGVSNFWLPLPCGWLSQPPTTMEPPTLLPRHRQTACLDILTGASHVHEN